MHLAVPPPLPVLPSFPEKVGYWLGVLCYVESACSAHSPPWALGCVHPPPPLPLCSFKYRRRRVAGCCCSLVLVRSCPPPVVRLAQLPCRCFPSPAAPGVRLLTFICVRARAKYGHESTSRCGMENTNLKTLIVLFRVPYVARSRAKKARDDLHHSHIGLVRPGSAPT